MAQKEFGKEDFLKALTDQGWTPEMVLELAKGVKRSPFAKEVVGYAEEVVRANQDLRGDLTRSLVSIELDEERKITVERFVETHALHYKNKSAERKAVRDILEEFVEKGYAKYGEADTYIGTMKLHEMLAATSSKVEILGSAFTYAARDLQTPGQSDKGVTRVGTLHRRY